MNKGKKWQLDTIWIESGNNMNKRARIPKMKERKTPAPQMHVILSQYLIGNKKSQI